MKLSSAVKSRPPGKPYQPGPQAVFVRPIPGKSLITQALELDYHKGTRGKTCAMRASGNAFSTRAPGKALPTGPQANV